MFLLLEDFGFFSGGSLGVFYKKTLISEKKLLVNSKTISNKISYFFILKEQLKAFQKFISISQYYLQLGCYLEIKIQGIGYKCWRYGESNFLFDLGYSHYILYKNIYNIFFRLNRTTIRCFSIDFYILGLVVSEILSLSKIDIYKGKGLFLSDQNLILKVGKQR